MVQNPTYYIFVISALTVIFVLLEIRRGSGILRIVVTVAGMTFLYLTLTDLLTPAPLSSQVAITNRPPEIPRVTNGLQEDGPYFLNPNNIPDSLTIVGDGLYSKSDLEAVSRVRVVNHLASPLPAGIAGIDYSENWIAGQPERLVIQLSDSSIKKLLVTAADGRIDTLEAAGLSCVATVTPRIEGQNIITLSGLGTDGAVLFNDSLPVNPISAPVFTIAALSNYPVPEINFLKNHLGEAGHSVTVRTQISTDRFAWDFLNTESDKSDIFRRLEAFDVLVMPVSALNSLGRIQLNEINSAIQNGLGLFVLYDEYPAFSAPDLPRLESSRIPALTVNATACKVFPYMIPKTAQAVSHSAEGNVLTAVSALGEGNISVSILTGSYSLLLQGDSTAYRNLWRDNLSSVLRAQSNEFSIQYPPFWQLRVNRQADIGIHSASEVSVEINGINVNVTQDLYQPDLWWVRYWPINTGWQTMILSNANARDTSSFYSFGHGWEYLRAMETRLMNTSLTGTGIEAVPFDYFPWQTVAWIVGLVACFTFLWLEPRIA